MHDSTGERVGLDIVGPPIFLEAAEVEANEGHDAEIVADILFSRWVCQHGVPDSVHTG